MRNKEKTSHIVQDQSTGFNLSLTCKMFFSVNLSRKARKFKNKFLFLING